MCFAYSRKQGMARWPNDRRDTITDASVAYIY